MGRLVTAAMGVLGHEQQRTQNVRTSLNSRSETKPLASCSRHRQIGGGGLGSGGGGEGLGGGGAGSGGGGDGGGRNSGPTIQDSEPQRGTAWEAEAASIAKPTMNFALLTKGVPAGREGGAECWWVRPGMGILRGRCPVLRAGTCAPAARGSTGGHPAVQDSPEASLQGRLSPSLLPFLASAIPGVTSAQNWVLASFQKPSHPARLTAGRRDRRCKAQRIEQHAGAGMHGLVQLARLPRCYPHGQMWQEGQPHHLKILGPTLGQGTTTHRS